MIIINSETSENIVYMLQTVDSSQCNCGVVNQGGYDGWTCCLDIPNMNAHSCLVGKPLVSDYMVNLGGDRMIILRLI